MPMAELFGYESWSIRGAYAMWGCRSGCILTEGLNSIDEQESYQWWNTWMLSSDLNLVIVDGQLLCVFPRGFLRFSFAQNFMIRAIKSYGMGLSSGN